MYCKTFDASCLAFSVKCFNVYIIGRSRPFLAALYLPLFDEPLILPPWPTA